MRDLQRADPAARRQAVRFLVVGAVVGAVLIAGLERYRTPLQEWLLAEPDRAVARLRLVVLLLGISMSVPLCGLGAYLWSLGGKVVRARQFPPPGQRVVRDTPLLTGQAAESRGRLLKVFGICLGVAGPLLALVLWRVVSVLDGSGAY
jgi:hypothetical protein